MTVDANTVELLEEFIDCQIRFFRRGADRPVQTTLLGVSIVDSGIELTYGDPARIVSHDLINLGKIERIEGEAVEGWVEIYPLPAEEDLPGEVAEPVEAVPGRAEPVDQGTEPVNQDGTTGSTDDGAEAVTPPAPNAKDSAAVSETTEVKVEETGTEAQEKAAERRRKKAEKTEGAAE